LLSFDEETAMELAGKASYEEVVYIIISFWYKKQTSIGNDLIRPLDGESLSKEELLKSRRVD